MQNIILTLMAVLVTFILLGSGVAIYENTNTSSQITTAVSNAETVLAGVRSTYQGQSGYSGLTTSVALSAGVFPSSMVAGTSVTDAFGGPVTVAANSTPAYFDLTYTQVPQKACVRLASAIQGSSIQSVNVNGTALTPPVNVASASGACKPGATNVIDWTSN